MRILAQIEPDTVAAVSVSTAFATAVGAVWTGVNVVLLLVMLSLFLVDQVVGMAKAYLIAPAGTRWFNGDVFMRGLVKKGMLVALVYVAAAMDVIGSMLPALGPVIAEYTFSFKTASTSIVVATASSIFANVAVVREARLALAILRKRASPQQAIALGLEEAEKEDQ